MKVNLKAKRLQSGSELGGTSQTVAINAPDKELMPSANESPRFISCTKRNSSSVKLSNKNAAVGAGNISTLNALYNLMSLA